MAKERIKTIGMCVSKKDYDVINKLVADINKGKKLEEYMSVSAFTKKLFMYGFKLVEYNNNSFTKTDQFIKDLFFIDESSDAEL